MVQPGEKNRFYEKNTCKNYGSEYSDHTSNKTMTLIDEYGKYFTCHHIE